MRPVIFKLGFFQVNAYMLFLSVAFCVFVCLVLRENSRKTNPLPITALIGIWLFFGAIQGARMWNVIQEDGWVAWREMFNPWGGGLAFHGGLAGGALAGVAYAKCVGAPLVPLFDLTLPYLALGEAITRIGCFLNGCCWGTPSNAFWAVQYPKGSHPFHHHVNTGLLPPEAVESLSVHPTQLYMAVCLMVVFFGLRYAYRNAAFLGFSTALYLAAQGVLRFGLEFLRGDGIPSVWGLSTAQLTSLVMILFAAVLFEIFRRHARRACGFPGDGTGEKPLLKQALSATLETNTMED